MHIHNHVLAFLHCHFEKAIPFDILLLQNQRTFRTKTPPEVFSRGKARQRERERVGEPQFCVEKFGILTLVAVVLWMWMWCFFFWNFSVMFFLNEGIVYNISWFYTIILVFFCSFYTYSWSFWVAWYWEIIALRSRSSGILHLSYWGVCYLNDRRIRAASGNVVLVELEWKCYER